MRDLKLKLSGSGIIIKHDAEIIRIALEKVGYVVEIDDPQETPDWFTMPEERFRDDKKITLTLDHEPWGG